uniref:GFA family protein n=1 Tax=Caballeronia sp. LjRoot34 TaxID=3342325 RepID=UPI003F4F6432
MTVYRGSCHCERVRFELEATLTELLVCDCSLCKKRNSQTVLVEQDALSITRGSDALTTYRWNTGVAKHHFCRSCGIYIYHETRTQPGRCAVNVNCIDSPDVPALPTRKIFGSALSVENAEAGDSECKTR